MKVQAMNLFLLFQRICFYLCLYLCFYVCYMGAGAGGDQKASDTLGLELKAAMSHLTWLLGTSLQPSAKIIASTLNCSINISPDLFLFNLCVLGGTDMYMSSHCTVYGGLADVSASYLTTVPSFYMVF